MKPRRFIQATLQLAAALLLTGSQLLAQQDYYFPNSGSFDPKVPTPEQFLGYPIGSHYTRHDEIVAYFKELARTSNRVHVEVIGKTYEERPLLIATITLPENYSRLESIRQEHITLADPAKPVIPATAPVVVHLGYSVHGNETSSGETGLLTAYYLAANQSAETQQWLKEAVVFIDPSQNPDGRDRAANWHNSYKSSPPVADPLDKEHVEAWPGGRANHYLNNLNRDWLALTQTESRSRIEFFHKWYPNVQIDFHEQGANSTYYFEPTPKRHQSPIIPQSVYDFNAVLAKYQAKALDDIGSLYFTKENYDNLSPIYGSTYPKFYGGVGATFEQASSRGLVQETSNGTLTFPFSIRNHLATGLATIRGAVAEKEGLFRLQKAFFQSALDQAKAGSTKWYLFGDSRDESLTQNFLDLLLKHRVQVYELNDAVTAEGKRFEKGKAYVVPALQPNFRIVHSLFEEIKLTDSIYYDNTGWSVIHAYGLLYAKIGSPTFAKGDAVKSTRQLAGSVDGGKSAYAYLLNWSDYNASKALYLLQQKGVLVKTSFKPFTANTPQGKQAFSFGTLVIPVAGQAIQPDSLYRALQQTAAAAQVRITSAASGFSAEGIDLGSNNIKALRQPQIALAFGQGVNYEEAGQVWFLLNQHLGLPVVKIDVSNFGQASLKKYNTIILVGGNYNSWEKPVTEKIKGWVADGGTLITFQNASAWASKQGITSEQVYVDSTLINRTAGVVPSEAGAAKGSNAAERLDYIRQEDVEGSKRINGAIFLTDVDTTNPIAFGINSRKLFINKNGSTLLVPSKNKYGTVAQYTSNAFISGYAPRQNIGKVNNSAAILTASEGLGKVVLFADDPTYRNYWLGTNRLLLNAIFFSNLISGGRQAIAAEAEE
ncbi:Zinc carboxypeptidase [Cnuella takakiae]|uniref:Zinc carboxypeptidase n=1 Tax=Cnuella takakiae TaxID=1302690 RepID=A0A1M4ZZC2_9BACT|nr:M14 family zinc carboxypeptidase [Cnuella takakiae]OLY92153.1 peptidase M14 [Cnuella takakiae]SHF23358.1 Zinc carboxypeptidase [Cnuella takakiae]